MAEFLVRLKPLNEKRGYKLRRFTIAGIRFEVDKGWYRVSEYVVNKDTKREFNLIEYLRNVTNDNEDKTTPLAFDVCTEEEANRIVTAETEAKERAARPTKPNPINTIEDAIEVGTAAPAPAAKKRGRPRKEVESDE